MDNFFLFTFLVVLVIGGRVKSEKCRIADSINITNGERNGTNYIHKSVVYRPEDYFQSSWHYDYHTNQVVTGEQHVRGCLCNIVDCVRFCCEIDYFENEVTEKCFYKSKIINKEYTDLVENYGVVIGKPCRRLVKFEFDEFILHENGQIEMHYDGLNYTHLDYCFAPTIIDNGAIVLAAFVCRDLLSEIPDIDNSAQEMNKFKIYPYALMISVIFLFITIIIYGCIPELRNLHGKCVLCYVCGLFTSYIILIFLQLKTDLDNSLFCVTIGFTNLSSFIFTFMWLNAMCVDIFWTFKGITGAKNVSDKKKFNIYVAYTTVVTLIVVGFAAIMQLCGASYNPEIGVDNCWIRQKWQVEFIFLYLPILIIIFINITLFTITAYTIRKLQNEILSTIKRGESSRHSLRNEKNTFSLYLRLFIIMGATWILEIITWITETNFGIHWISFIPDMCNILQGLVIFFFIVWKPSVKKLIVKRFKKIRGDKITDTKTERSTSSKLSDTTTTFEEIQLKKPEINYETDVK